MEIEENQEEDIFFFIRERVTEVRELASKWNSKGGNRSESVGSDLEFQAGHLGTLLDLVWEEVQDEESELSREISSYMAEMELWVSHVQLRRYLNEMKGVPLKAQEESEDDKRKEEIDMEIPRQSEEDQFDSGTESVGGQFAAQNEGEITVLGNILDHKLGAEDEEEEKIESEVVDAFTVQSCRREELARDFEKKILMAARDLHTETAVWMVGFKLDDPIFLLVMDKTNSEMESGLDPKRIGSPPWLQNPLSEGEKQMNIGPEFNSGPVLIPIDKGSKIELRDGLQGESAWLTALHSPENSHCLTVHTREQRSFAPPLPAPKQPPPQPPDLLPRENAAGDDPGDLQFLDPIAFTSKFKHNLEDKVNLKELARVVGFSRGENSIVQPPPEPPPPYLPMILVLISLILYTGNRYEDGNLAAVRRFLQSVSEKVQRGDRQVVRDTMADPLMIIKVMLDCIHLQLHVRVDASSDDPGDYKNLSRRSNQLVTVKKQAALLGQLLVYAAVYGYQVEVFSKADNLQASSVNVQVETGPSSVFYCGLECLVVQLSCQAVASSKGILQIDEKGNIDDQKEFEVQERSLRPEFLLASYICVQRSNRNRCWKRSLKEFEFERAIEFQILLVTSLSNRATSIQVCDMPCCRFIIKILKSSLEDKACFKGLALLGH